MTTASEAIRAAADLSAHNPDEPMPPPRSSWIRGVGNHARCDNLRCTTRSRGAVQLYQTIHNDGTARAYATQLCVPCKLQQMAEEFAADGMLPRVDPPQPIKNFRGEVVLDEAGEPKLAEMPDPDWQDAAMRKPVNGVLLNREQFEACVVMTRRLIGTPDDKKAKPVELVSEDKRKARERRKAEPETREELSGKRAEIRP